MGSPLFRSPRGRLRPVIVAILLAIFAVPCLAALPTRLVLLLDGVSYRDMKMLQEGAPLKDRRGRPTSRQAFNVGYYPVSRLISTFPSISDPAWTEILGNHPPPGYQRTYFNAANSSQVSLNGITSLIEYEKQMSGPVEDNFSRVMSYVFPSQGFKREVNALIENFLQSDGVSTYYALIHSTDVAQHVSGNIFALLTVLDQRLQELRAVYREREGKELEILILSDHGNNHAGLGHRVGIEGFLKKAGYHIATSIRRTDDIVLPTAGIESWIEIHNSPAETERLMQLLPGVPGVDIVTARRPNQPDCFIVANSAGARATIDFNPDRNSFRYAIETGDPLDYQPVIDALARKKKFDAQGFASADDWMNETLAHNYPVALERIVRGHTAVTANPASILISLKSNYVHCGFIIRRGIVLIGSGGTHGGLNHIDSTGVLLSSFTPTRDTTSSRVAAQFDGFNELRKGQNDGSRQPAKQLRNR